MSKYHIWVHGFVLWAIHSYAIAGSTDYIRAYDYICPAGYWGETTNNPAYNFMLCRLCSDWGAEYTSDGGDGYITSCYTTCDDGQRVYWPNTCSDTLCAKGAYMATDGTCTICENKYYCPGDNTKIACADTLDPDDPPPSYIYTFTDGYTFTNNRGRHKNDCYCDWALKCDDGSCETYKATRACWIGPGDDVRLTPEKCSNGYYATEYNYNHGAYERCIPCTGLPENATFTSYGTPDKNHANGDNCPWACNTGLGRTSVDTCAPLCTAGVTRIRIAPNISIPLFRDKNTTHTINIGHNNTVCYADLAPGRQSGTINIDIDGQIYHTTNE